MGRRKVPERFIKAGQIRSVDKRKQYLRIFKEIISRQWSKNVWTEDNFSIFPIPSLPIETNVLVLEHTKFFGKDYVKILVSSTNQDSRIGWMTLYEFVYSTRGYPIWESRE